MNATQDQLTVLSEVAGSTCLSVAGRNRVNCKAERAILLPAFPELRSCAISETPFRNNASTQTPNFRRFNSTILPTMRSFNDLILGSTKAGESSPHLRRMLRSGGMAVWSDGKHTKTLSHIPALHGPIQRLPWPLSMMQSHLFEFRIYEEGLKGGWAKPGTKPLHEHLYKKSEMEIAIEEFLRGSKPDDEMTITDS